MWRPSVLGCGWESVIEVERNLINDSFILTYYNKRLVCFSPFWVNIETDIR